MLITFTGNAPPLNFIATLVYYISGQVLSGSKQTFLRLAGLCGVIGPLVALSSIALAVERSPWFSWTGNAMSDLGARANSSALFNTGLIVGGVLIAVFALGLRKSLKSRAIGNAGALAFLLTAAALCSVGIFPETAGDIHRYVSVVFFVLLVISLWLVGAALVQLGERGLGLVIIIAGVVAATVWAYPWPAEAIPELVAALAASACSITLGVRAFKSG
jgi:hypothetical membrane protein